MDTMLNTTLLNNNELLRCEVYKDKTLRIFVPCFVLQLVKCRNSHKPVLAFLTLTKHMLLIP